MLSPSIHPGFAKATPDTRDERVDCEQAFTNDINRATNDRSSRVFFESQAEKKVSRDSVFITSSLVGQFNAQNILAAMFKFGLKL